MMMEVDPMTETYPLTGKNAIVTGAGNGIGKALALGLASAGVRVILIDLDGDAAGRVAEEINLSCGGKNSSPALAETLDTTSERSCDLLAGRLDERGIRVDFLVNNAGIFPAARPGDVSFRDAWRQTIDVNLMGYMNMTTAFLGHLRQSKGRIVNIGSVHCWTAPEFAVHYAASKSGVLSMTKSLAGVLAPDGIRVNGIAPGIMATQMTEATRSDPVKIARYLENVPMARVGEPAELVGPLLFLLSDASSYVTGVMLPVDGGYLTF